MPLTPSQAFEHTREALAQYLETQYRISNPVLFHERGKLLREPKTIAQTPFIESTPSFAQDTFLSELEKIHPQQVTPGLAELVQHGVPVDRFPLYVHQRQALLGAYSDKPNLLVATGTGSGKTESFLLPILSDILREAKNWLPPAKEAARGHYDLNSKSWHHSRRHETRPAAMRAIILYPMNALVNDQLTRLRRILSKDNSPSWQHKNLNGNFIHFGMYTGLSRQSGYPYHSKKQKLHSDYMQTLDTNWAELEQPLRDTGNWARPDSTEMLTRWDMQAAPPDILVTNYSMLEYMLLRPIEDPMFEETRKWLAEYEDARFTLVVDEAHTYTGAKGTEVGHLIRRLKVRLGLTDSDPRFRGIATTASVPTGKDQELRTFVSGLFGETPERFTLIKAASRPAREDRRAISESVMKAYAKFHDNFNLDEPEKAIKELAENLRLELPSMDITGSEVLLYELLKDDPYIEWARERTARNATQLDQLAGELWQGHGDQTLREHALSGVIAAGSYARSSMNKDTPPLLSVRLHAFFRGVAGLWACSDPNCKSCDQTSNRPVGKLYMDPRPWCDCGARVLTVFTCRKCGLMFLGGIPDNDASEDGQPGLWPWSSDLSGKKQNQKDFHIYGVEPPHAHSIMSYRSTRTTWSVTKENIFSRPAYEIKASQNTDELTSHFPKQCPRCQAWRNPQSGREVIEPLDTKGVQAFAAIVEEGFRHQPKTSTLRPNYGRKGMIFSDSRKEAAKLAEDIKSTHYRATFRQLIYRVLHSCTTCNGDGSQKNNIFSLGQKESKFVISPCAACSGTGLNPSPRPLSYSTLLNSILVMMTQQGIDPTHQSIPQFFSKIANNDPDTVAQAKDYLTATLLEEIVAKDFSLEPLGLGYWRVPFKNNGIELSPGSLTGELPKLTTEESETLLNSVISILISKCIITAPAVPPNRAPWDWGHSKDLIKNYMKNTLYYYGHQKIARTYPNGQRTGEDVIPFSFKHEGWDILARFMHAVAKKLIDTGRIQVAEKDTWLEEIREQIFEALCGYDVLSIAGAEVPSNNQRYKVRPHGIRMSRLVLYPITDTVDHCKACGYIMANTFFDICVRCGEDTESFDPALISNFFREITLYGSPDSKLPDPYPLRASEHSAQVDAKEARDEERWFQDLFHDDQDDLDYRVDLLSVTTTMEMGIDIGSLLLVGLRNVPPTIANYQQRAGRAGRRGSALATVYTFAKFRSHDQYYYDHPPQIVTDAPRVPTIHLNNDVIAHRHVRSVVLQKFFLDFSTSLSTTSNLFDTWGTVKDYAKQKISQNLVQYIGIHRAELINKLRRIVHSNIYGLLDEWLDALDDEINAVVEGQSDSAKVYGVIMEGNLLPKYAFPIDVVTLTVKRETFDNDSDEYSTPLTRDLKQGISEYAPGAELPRQENQVTNIITSVGLYDPFDKNPDFRPQGFICECKNCQSVNLYKTDNEHPTVCITCDSTNIQTFYYYRPRGFTADTTQAKAPIRYETNSGLEQSGYSSHASLYTGETSFTSGSQVEGMGGRLYTHVRIGDLVITNKGSNLEYEGYFICPKCGRSLDPNSMVSHDYPADIPPHQGNKRGPRAGTPCEYRPPYTNKLILAHTFKTEVIFLGVALPPELDAPFAEVSGQALWYSFGTLVAIAATRILQIDPGELKAGARAILQGKRLHGEVFIYDDVPGGAGYARNIMENLHDILKLALVIGSNCENPHCAGACYQCLLDHRNQYLHPVLNRQLGVAMLNFVLHGNQPFLTESEEFRAAEMLEPYARTGWKVISKSEHSINHFPIILEKNANARVAMHVIHPLQTRNNPKIRQQANVLGLQLLSCTTFDLERRPFWVMNRVPKP